MVGARSAVQLRGEVSDTGIGSGRRRLRRGLRADVLWHPATRGDAWVWEDDWAAVLAADAGGDRRPSRLRGRRDEVADAHGCDADRSRERGSRGASAAVRKPDGRCRTRWKWCIVVPWAALPRLPAIEGGRGPVACSATSLRVSTNAVERAAMSLPAMGRPPFETRPYTGITGQDFLSCRASRGTRGYSVVGVVRGRAHPNLWRIEHLLRPHPARPADLLDQLS